MSGRRMLRRYTPRGAGDRVPKGTGGVRVASVIISSGLRAEEYTNMGGYVHLGAGLAAGLAALAAGMAIGVAHGPPGGRGRGAEGRGTGGGRRPLHPSAPNLVGIPQHAHLKAVTCIGHNLIPPRVKSAEIVRQRRIPSRAQCGVQCGRVGGGISKGTDCPKIRPSLIIISTRTCWSFSAGSTIARTAREPGPLGAPPPHGPVTPWGTAACGRMGNRTRSSWP